MQGREPRMVGARPSESSEIFSDPESCSPSSNPKTRISSFRSQHPFEDGEKLRSCVKLLDAKSFRSLPSPLPRAQDLPEEYFGTPSLGDEVISVSHAWRNQAHPDPTCCKTALLAQLLSKLSASESLPSLKEGTAPRVFLFLDFVSIPQKPFQLGQEPRSALQEMQFEAALECMHKVFYYSDRIIHLPWENVPVPGEGVERTVPAAELQGPVLLAQVGGAVQVAQAAAAAAWRPSDSKSSSRDRGPRLFDQVVSVDGQEVRTVKEAESLLDKAATEVRLRSYPFGMSNSIPADVRGWIFLERFISMVKCAMMDEETARQIIITPSEGIFQEIMNGASKLRHAALQDMKSRKSEQLKQVLESFVLELQSKQFTAASTDKREAQEQSSSSIWEEDRNIVHSIMKQFVEHLAEHWEEETAKQRGFAARLGAVVAATEVFLLEWDSFSEDYAKRLANAARMNPWPVALVVCVPLLVTTTLLLPPYAHPDKDWKEQTTFWGCSSVSWFCCYHLFPIFLAHSTGMSTNPTLYVRLILWALAATAVMQLAAVAVASSADVFPVPGLHMLSAGVGISLLPALWWCIPVEQRRSKQFRMRLICALVALSLVVTLLGVCTPMLNAAIPHVSEGWQVLIVGGYLGIKLIFEGVGRALSRHLGADAMPNIVFLATCCYQINLCMAFSKVSSWWIVVEQVCLDVLENVYHVWSIRSPRNTARHEQYIVASLVLREFVELMVPLQFLIMHKLLRKVRPEYSVLLCNKVEEEMQRTERVLQVDIGVEFVVSCLTYVFLARRGHAPLLMLRGLAATRLVLLVVVAGAVLLYYSCMTHTHWGMDLSFRFLWLLEDTAEWECGLTWHVPG